MLEYAFRRLFLVGLFASVVGQKKSPPRKIGIIGGGIAGTSASYFIREQFGKDVQIDLFEPSPVLGGRMATVEIAGREYESGASIIHPKNLYMKSFARILDLQEAKRHGGTIGIFDGEEYILRTSEWWIVTFLKMLWTFGLDLLRISWLEDRFLENFEKIYDIQSDGESYTDVGSLLHAMGGDDFIRATQITAGALFGEDSISKFTIDNFISPAVRVNYGQNTSVNGFVGAVAKAGIQSGLWSVEGGNKKVCEKLVVKSSANVIKERVASVKHIPGGKEGQFSILTEQRPETEQFYDIVILAAPIGRDMSDIDLTKACSDIKTCPTAEYGEERYPFEYRRTVANFVRGKLNSQLFQCNDVNDCPSTVLVPNQKTFYRSIGLHMPVDYDPEVDEVIPVYKVFATTPLTKDQLSYLFEVYSETTTVDWRAYPHYHRPPEKLESMVLNEAGLYYTSPIEWAASAMEMSAISGKNAVLLAYNNWYGHQDKIHSDVDGSGQRTQQKSEL